MQRTFDKAFNKLLYVIDEICETTCFHKVLFYVANKFEKFDFSQCLCTRYVKDQ